jgi:hypothetical protein
MPGVEAPVAEDAAYRLARSASSSSRLNIVAMSSAFW